jgi:hypothetical protein
MDMGYTLELLLTDEKLLTNYCNIYGIWHFQFSMVKVSAALWTPTILRASGRAQFMGVPTFPFPVTVASLVPPTLLHHFPHRMDTAHVIDGCLGSRPPSSILWCIQYSDQKVGVPKRIVQVYKLHNAPRTTAF